MNKIILIILVVCTILVSGCTTTNNEHPPATTPSPKVQPTKTEILPPPSESPPVPTEANIAYMEDDNPNHVLDVYLPADTTNPLPTLLMLHGAPGAKEDLTENGDYFAKQGLAVVIPEYDYGVENQVMYESVFCSFAWLHNNADRYNFDPRRIYIFGYSFGGLLSASLGSFKEITQYLESCPHTLPEEDQVKGIITFAGLFVTQEVCMAPDQGWCMAEAASVNNIPLMEMATIFETLREIHPSDWKDSDELSDTGRSFAQELPLYWIDGSEPPFLIIHGDADEAISMAESEAFAMAIQEAGGQAKFIALPGAGHFSLSLASPSFEKIASAVEDFLVQN